MGIRTVAVKASGTSPLSKREIRFCSSSLARSLVLILYSPFCRYFLFHFNGFLLLFRSVFIHVIAHQRCHVFHESGAEDVFLGLFLNLIQNDFGIEAIHVFVKVEEIPVKKERLYRADQAPEKSRSLEFQLFLHCRPLLKVPPEFGSSNISRVILTYAQLSTRFDPICLKDFLSHKLHRRWMIAISVDRSMLISAQRLQSPCRPRVIS